MTPQTLTLKETPLEQGGKESYSPIKKIHFQAMLLVMILSLTYVTYVTQFDKAPSHEVVAIQDKADLVFKDGEHGEILIQVIDQQNGDIRVVNELQLEGEQGFLRGTLRALARERRTRQLSPDVAFQLILQKDGHLSITDPLTKNTIALEAFGPDNLGVFIKLLNESKTALTKANTNNLTDSTKDMK